MLIEILVTYYLDTQIFKERKYKIKLKTTLKHRILLTILKYSIIGILIGAVTGLIFYLAETFRFEGLKNLIYVILAPLIFLVTKYFLGLSMRAILESVSYVMGRFFGDMGEILKKIVLKTNRSSTKMIIIFIFFSVFVTTNTVTYISEEHQNNILLNAVGGDLTLSELKAGEYLRISRESGINESLAIFFTYVDPPLQEQIGLVPMYFVERGKLEKFLHYNQLKDNYISHLKETLDLFTRKSDKVIISKALEDKLIYKEYLNLLPKGDLEKDEIYIEEKPWEIKFGILASLEYLPFFSEQNKYWIVAPIDGKYPLNTTYTNMMMIKLNEYTSIEDFQQKLTSKFPEVKILTKKTLSEKMQNKWFHNSLRAQTIIILIVGITMLMAQSPEEYLQIVENFYSRGMPKTSTRKIILGYQVSMQTMLFLIAFAIGLGIAWTIMIVQISRTVFNYRIVLNPSSTLIFLGGMILAQILFPWKIKEKK